MEEITVEELKNILDQNDENVHLIDVREEAEWDIAHIQGATLKPLSSLEYEYEDIPQGKRVIAYCKMGGRSQQAALFLESKGYENVANVRGGIDAWANEIDTSMPKY